MTKYVYPIFLLLLSATTFAQRADSVVAGDRPTTYAPGRWSVGLRYDLLPFRTTQLSTYAPGIAVGYNLFPRLAVQLGLTPTNLSYVGGGEMQPLPTLTVPSNDFNSKVAVFSYRPGLYVPLTLRYAFTSPYRRVQPYLIANLHAYVSAVRLAVYTYENGQLTGAPPETSRWRTSGLGAAAGFGLRIRTIDRFFLNGDMALGRTYQGGINLDADAATGNAVMRGRRSFTALLGVGLTYEFR